MPPGKIPMFENGRFSPETGAGDSYLRKPPAKKRGRPAPSEINDNLRRANKKPEKEPEPSQ